jgi:DNA-binding transcriptional LysR family regulator
MGDIGRGGVGLRPPAFIDEAEPLMDLGLVASFMTLVDEEHFGRAAARLHLTSPALTKRIQRLERQLGVTLIERGSAGMLALTPAGQQFAADAVAVLARADAACNAARDAARAGAARRRTLRLGIPAGTGATLRHIDVASIARTVRLNFPDISLTCLQVPFPALARCLPAGQVDVLWANGPVRHPAVDSFPMAVTSTRIGVVSDRHPLADAGVVDVQDFLRYPIGYNPTVPAEFMNLLWLGDLQSRRDAHLIEIDAQNQASILRRAVDGAAVMVTYPLIASPLSPQLRAVRLNGAAPVCFFVARRRTDRHGPIHALTEAIRTLSPRRLPSLPGLPAKPGST